MKFISAFLFTMLFILALCGCNRKNTSTSSQTVQTELLAETNISPATNISAVEHSEKEDFNVAFARHLEEITNRVAEHYNSAEETAYRKEIETKKHFNHLRIMNEIQNGSGDATELRVKFDAELKEIEDAHSAKEAEWQKDEDKWDAEWRKNHQ